MYKSSRRFLARWPELISPATARDGLTSVPELAAHAAATPRPPHSAAVTTAAAVYRDRPMAAVSRRDSHPPPVTVIL